MADDSNNMEFETIIGELQRVKDIQQKQEEIEEKLSETTEDVEDVKVSTEDVEKVIGIKESDKKKNVIDGDKLSTTLTTSEKKRYENIGKVFIEGAGKEIENVRKAVQFKDAMSTVKNKFSEGIVKFKEGLKKAQKEGSFFGKLMIIIGLLGTIVYLFRDKILKAFPNIGEQITNIFETVKGVLANLLGSIVNYVTQGIGSTFMELLKEVVVNVIPKFIGTFFQFTLPNAIVTLYLGILSAFSGDASQMYDQRVEKMINEDIEQLGEAASNELKQKADAETQAVKGLIDSTHESMKRVNALNIDSEYEELRRAQMGAAAVAMVSKPYTNVFNQLDQVITGDLRKLIDSGDFSASIFMGEIKRLKEGGLTKDEIIEAMNASVTDKLRSSNAIDGSKLNVNDISEFANSIIKMSDDAQTRQNDIAAIVRQKSERDMEQQNRLNEYKTTITEINATNVISKELANAFGELVKSIVQFLSGQTIAEALKDSFNSMNTQFETFFSSFNGFIKTSLTSVGDNFIKIFNLLHTNVAELKTKVDKLEGTYVVADGNEAEVHQNVYCDFNAIVNIDLSENSQSSSISDLVSQVVSIDEELSKVMNDSNTIMGEVIANFSKIRDLHACSKLYITEEVAKNNEQLDEKIASNTSRCIQNAKAISEINNVIKQPVRQPIAIGSTAPCLNVS